MQGKLQDQIAFYLTGRRDGPGLMPLDAAYRPALFAGYADLASLRYDLPLVLNREGGPDRAVLSLSRMVDDAVAEMNEEPDRDRVARHGYRMERAIRQAMAGSGRADLEEMWKTAAERLADAGDETARDSAARLWRAFRAAGDLVDVDADMPGRVIRHAWQAAQAVKAAAFRERAERLLFRLRNILDAETIASPAGRSPDRLMAAVGSSFAASFDFDTMSRLLTEAKPNFGLSDRRRERIRWLIDVIGRQRFFAMGDGRSEPYAFDFGRCAEALDAYRNRRDEAVTLLKALAIAELEANGEYRESAHDLLFEGYGANGLDAAELARLPDYLISIDADGAGPAERAELIEMLAAGLPVKVLVRTDDILEPAPLAEGHITLGLGARQLVQTAIGLTDVFVVQAAASHIFQRRGSIAAALDYEGPALFSVFSGTGGRTAGIPPYLVAAAAMGSRAFPALVYDPSAGNDWATRFDVSDNPVPEQDWPVRTLRYEDGSLQARQEDAAFTFADFAALDARCAGHFAVVGGEDAAGAMISIGEALQEDPTGLPERVPGIALVDNDGKLCRAIVDRRTMLETKRCLAMWHSLQELGGIHNSHAERMLARERAAIAESARVSDALPQTADMQAEAPAAVEQAAARPAPAAEAAPDEGHGDDPYIETARCTSCNECTNVNNRMFAYNAEKQAYIADPDAGTFRQLVEAAEGCQVSIIHPGKPRNPKEPGLEDLIKRAAPFN